MIKGYFIFFCSVLTKKLYSHLRYASTQLVGCVVPRVCTLYTRTFSVRCAFKRFAVRAIRDHSARVVRARGYSMEVESLGRSALRPEGTNADQKKDRARALGEETTRRRV